MRRDTGIGPRLAATLVLGFVLSVLSTTLFAWWSAGPLRLQPVIIMVVSAGFRLPLLAGGALTLVLGYLTDVTSGGVSGLQMSGYILVLCACALAERKLEISSWPFQMMAAGAMSLLFQVAVIGGILLISRRPLVPPNLPWVLLSQAALTALTAPVFFALLEWTVRLFDHFWPQRRPAGG